MKQFWRKLSISKKLFCITFGILFLVVLQVSLIFSTLGGMLSIRALIIGESIWSKAQKDAIHNLYQYAYLKEEKYLDNFNRLMKVFEGDMSARLELEKKDFDISVVREGFRAGQVEESEIDGIIRVLSTFRDNHYIKMAVSAWEQADYLMIDLKEEVPVLRYMVQNHLDTRASLERIGMINEKLSTLERKFSASLQEGSRWAEDIMQTMITLVILVIQVICIYLFYKFSSYLASTLKVFKEVAVEVGNGNFSVAVPVNSSDELGHLGGSLNKMIDNLKFMSSMQKNTEESLRRSNDRFSTMIDAVKDYAIFNLDLEGRVKSWNSGAENIFGFNYNEVVNQHFSIFYCDEDVNLGLPANDLHLVIKYGRYEREVLRQRKNGEKFWANVILIVRNDKFGKIEGISKVVRDITERKEYELQLKKSNVELENRIEFRTKELQWRESQLSQITNALPECVCHIDVEQKFLFVNESFCKLVDLDKTEIISSTIAKILGKENYALLKPHIKDVLKGRGKSFETTLQIKGQELIFSINLVPEYDEDGGVFGFVLVAHDIRKYKEIESELIKSKELADVANKTKSAFLANMSHEIRTPLGAVLGFSELIINNEVSDAQRKNIADAIKRNGHLLSSVINDILDLSKVEAGKLEIEQVNILFEDVIKDIESLLALRASEKGIQLSISASDRVPRVIRTDPLRLRQILLNIVGNAIKFTQEGQVAVRVDTFCPVGSNQLKLTFLVEDSGLGMTATQTEKLFTPFSQADVSTTRKFGGSGLGLILSKKLAQALGGDVTLMQSKENEGSTFSVMIDAGLPLHTNNELQVDTKASFEVKNVESQFDFRAYKLLLVEDSLDNQLIVAHFLNPTGIDLKIANNGQECLDFIAEEKYDLILLDIQMPVMGGFDTIKKIKELEITTPVLALTANAMKEDIRQCLQAGFNAHLSKPINRLLLLSTIDTWLNGDKVKSEAQDLA